MKKFEELTEREVLALAIALEEEDERVYADFAEGLRQDYPATASMFDGMREEESGHRRRLLELFQQQDCVEAGAPAEGAEQHLGRAHRFVVAEDARFIDARGVA